MDSLVDASLFIYQHNWEFIYVMFYVDNRLITRNIDLVNKFICVF